MFSRSSKFLLLLSGLMLLAIVCGSPPNAYTSSRPNAAPAVQRGNKIAFLGSVGGGMDIYLVGSDGSGLENLTRGRLSGISAFSWSPDGSQLVVSADRGSNLYVVAADGSTIRALTHNTGFAITQTPTWSPDGSQIAYIGNAAQNYDVFLINPDGSNVRRLTQTNGIYRDLAWSPDGSRIAYASGADFFNVRIYTMRADGSAPIQVSSGGGSDSAPAWSPDGSRIAYQNDFQFGPPEIFVVNSDGSKQTRLTSNFASDRRPSWSPDGGKIAFASDRNGASVGGAIYSIYVMNPDGSSPERVTDTSIAAQNPAWQPHSSVISPPGAPRLMTEGATNRAVVLDSMTLMREPLPVFTTANFSVDRHTRALLFLANLDRVAVDNNLAITVRLTDAQQRVFDLKPESINPIPKLESLVQLTIKLPDELSGGGDVEVSVTVGGLPSNTAVFKIAPSMRLSLN